MEVNLDGSANFPWKVARGVHNAFTITFDSDISAYTNWRFNVKLKGGPGTPVLTLAPDDGLTVVDSVTITGEFTSAQTSGLKKPRYYYELIADNASGHTVPFFRSEDFIVQNENSSQPTSNVSATLSLSSSTVNVVITVGGSPISNTATALTDGASIDLTAIKHSLTSSQAAITFTISYAGDFTSIELTLNTTSATWTFPEGSLCISEGVASGNNTLTLEGTSGDKYTIGIMKFGDSYSIAAKNLSR